jgi:hypothetical protein
MWWLSKQVERAQQTFGDREMHPLQALGNIGRDLRLGGVETQQERTCVMMGLRFRRQRLTGPSQGNKHRAASTMAAGGAFATSSCSGVWTRRSCTCIVNRRALLAGRLALGASEERKTPRGHEGLEASSIGGSVAQKSCQAV